MSSRDIRLEKLFKIISLAGWIPIWIAFALVLIFAGVANLLMGQIGTFAFAELGIGLLMLLAFLIWKRRALAYIDDSARDR
jgi:hypothetical protein